MQLLEKIESSEYLSGILALHSDLEDYASGRKIVDAALLQLRIDALTQHAASTISWPPENTEESSTQLREQKQRFSLLWSIADLASTVSFMDLGRLQSLFAERSIQRALEISWRSKRISRFFVNPDNLPASKSGIFVVALGKLGGI